MSKRARNQAKNFVKVEKALADEISSFLFQLGQQFQQIKNASGAFDCFKYSLDLNPLQQPAVHNLGVLYSLQGNLEGAYRMFSEACRMDPSSGVAKLALAEVCRKMVRIDEALKLLDQVEAVDPGNSHVASTRSSIYYDQGRVAEASKFNELALTKEPKNTVLHLNKALVSMSYGNWPEHWPMYEMALSYRENNVRMRGRRMSDSWSGEPMEGKTLLIISDQGAGDAIQFSRYFREAREIGKFGKMIFLVQPDLVELMRSSGVADEVVGFNEVTDITFDAFSSLIGIMRVLRVPQQLAYRNPHIVVSQELMDIWRDRLLRMSRTNRKRVGLVWAGDPRHGNDHNRSIPLAKFGSILSLGKAEFFSFQVGPAERQLGGMEGVDPSICPHALGEDFRTFTDTAAALSAMDLLISVDTSVAHLAGCMGIPTWVMLPNPAEWRWLLSGDRSPWYGPDFELFRQQTARDWELPLEAVRERLLRWS